MVAAVVVVIFIVLAIKRIILAIVVVVVVFVTIDMNHRGGEEFDLRVLTVRPAAARKANGGKN